MKGRTKNVNASRFTKKTSPDTFVRSLTYHHGHRMQKAETPCHEGQLKPSCPDCEHNTSNRLAAFTYENLNFAFLLEFYSAMMSNQMPLSVSFGVTPTVVWNTRWSPTTHASGASILALISSGRFPEELSPSPTGCSPTAIAPTQCLGIAYLYLGMPIMVDLLSDDGWSVLPLLQTASDYSFRFAAMTSTPIARSI